ncbi:MAG TPA: hypothetical protein VEA59_04750 [Patescibacteria group bacterium]|nr:hypothetical protein [Patescibacteria group bacterium]
MSNSDPSLFKMSFTRFLGLGFLYVVLVCIGKLFVVQFLGTGSSNVWWMFVLYISLIAVALIRRLGVINFLESFLTIGTWTFFSLTGDVVVSANLAGLVIYKTWYFWLGYLVAAVCMLLLHKKQHVLGKKLRKAHGAHH